MRAAFREEPASNQQRADRRDSREQYANRPDSHKTNSGSDERPADQPPQPRAPNRWDGHVRPSPTGPCVARWAQRPGDFGNLAFPLALQHRSQDLKLLLTKAHIRTPPIPALPLHLIGQHSPLSMDFKK